LSKESEYINDYTAIDHCCLAHGRTYKTRPNDIKGGHVLRCCKEPQARKSGSLIDTVCRAILVLLTRQGNAFIYLYKFELNAYAKYGIAFDPAERA